MVGTRKWSWPEELSTVEVVTITYTIKISAAESADCGSIRRSKRFTPATPKISVTAPTGVAVAAIAEWPCTPLITSSA